MRGTAQPMLRATRAHRAVHSCHVTGIRVNVNRIHGNFGLWNQLLVVVRLQVPDVNGTALITHN